MLLDERIVGRYLIYVVISVVVDSSWDGNVCKVEDYINICII